MLKKQNDMQGLSLRTGDAFPVVASLPPKMRLLLSWGRKTSQLHENPELT